MLLRTILGLLGKMPRLSPAIGVVLLGLMLAASGIAVAAIPSEDGIITTCRNTSSGTLRVIDTADMQQGCTTKETQLDFAAAVPSGGGDFATKAELQSAVQQLQQQIAALQASVSNESAARQQADSQQQNQLASLQAQTQDQQLQLASLQEQNQQQQLQIFSLQAQSSLLQSQIGFLQAQISQQELQIDGLSQRVTALETSQP